MGLYFTHNVQHSDNHEITTQAISKHEVFSFSSGLSSELRQVVCVPAEGLVW